MLIESTITRPEGLDQSILDIATKTRSNPLAWNGQFSPQLIESLFSSYGHAARVVLDPFVGSGTVAAEAIRTGKKFIGSEVNPAAFALARIYSLAALSPQVRQAALDNCMGLLRHAVGSKQDLVLEGPWPLASDIGEPVRVLIFAALLLTFKSAKQARLVDMERAFLRIGEVLATLPAESAPVEVRLADARKLPFDDDAADFLITSPPYINVYNYHQQYRPIVEALGCVPLRAASAEIGANRKHRGNRFLTVVQYCIDLALVAVEASRVCRSGSHAIWVIGRESNVLGVPFQNGVLANRIFVEVLGWAPLLAQSRSFTNRFGQQIHEELLHYDVRKCRFDAGQLAAVRLIGVQALELGLRMNPTDRNALEAAIDHADAVNASPLYVPAHVAGSHLAHSFL